MSERTAMDIVAQEALDNCNLRAALKALVEAVEMPGGSAGTEREWYEKKDAIDKALFEANKLLYPRRYEK